MNFYLRLRSLDRELAGSHQCAIPTGRAYLGAQGPYADKIHVTPFAENLQALPPIEPSKTSLYMGTAGLINFGYMRQLKPDYAILFDVNPFQIIFWNTVLSSIRHNESFASFKQVLSYAETFTRDIVARKMGDIQFSSAGSWTEALSYNDGVSLTRRNFASSAASFASYLESISFDDYDYARLRDMVCEGRIGTLTLDMFDPLAWGQLGGFLQGLHHTIDGFPVRADCLYISSVLRFAQHNSDWTGRVMHGATLQGLSAVLREKSMIVDYQGSFPFNEFEKKVQEDKPWLLSRQMNTIKASARVSGGAR